MKKSFAILSFTMLLLTPMRGSCQQRSSVGIAEGLKLIVKHFDDFIDRFNFEVDILGKPITDTAHVYIEQGDNVLKLTRDLAVTFLIDAELWKIHPERCQRFVDAVTGNQSQMLSFYDKDWFAIRPSLVNYKGKEQHVRFTMQIEVNPEVGSKWVICGVDAPFLNSGSNKQNKDLLITPDSNENGFVALKRVFSDAAHFEEYLPNSFGTDALTRLSRAIKRGELEYISSHGQQEYHLLQIPGWAVLIQYFKRADQNRGWLISELHELTASDKELYRSETLSIGK